MKKITLGLFLLTCLLQWYIPASMIWEQENTVSNGTAFKFKTIPIDPTDLFRGKYITLNYEVNNVVISNSEAVDLDQLGEKVYVRIIADSEGFAQVKSLSHTPPTDTPDYTTAYITSTRTQKDSMRFRLKYPFQKYFMEETKAKKAEDLSRNIRRDSSQIVYGLVNIKDGNAALVDVQVDGVSIKDLVNKK